ncbi:MAG: alpha/beta hydrolase family protein [Gemmatimonadota bacterium]
MNAPDRPSACILPLRLLPALLLITAGALPAGAQVEEPPRPPGPEAVAGTWSGALQLPASRLTIVFHISAKGDSLTGTWDSPDQGAMGLPASGVSFDGTTLAFEMASVGAAFRGTLSPHGDTLSGTFTQGGAVLPLTLTRSDEGPRPSRPQEPEPPFPYAVEEVHIPNSDAPGVVLAGTLTLPDGAGPFPGVVLVSGSGPQNRNEELLGHKTFLVLADHLTREGVAVLRYDDRGVASSTGDFAAATTRDLASDARAAFEFLRSRPETTGCGVGILGHSEGGLIAPMVAAEDPEVAFLVLLAAPGLPGLEILKLQSTLIGEAEGAADETLRLNAGIQDRLARVLDREPDPGRAAPELRAVLESAWDSLPPAARERMGDRERWVETQVRQVNSPWFRYFVGYDPRPVLERVGVPVLALYGERDLQVPPEPNLREVASALRRGGNTRVTAVTLPGLNHLFQSAATGSPAEYARISETISPTALTAISDWILRLPPCSN